MPRLGLLALVLAGLAAPAHAAPPESALAGRFDSDTAVAIALARSPGLEAAAHRIRAAEHFADAERRADPTRISFDIWQVPLARPWAWNESPMVMLGVSQPIAPAGSRKARSAARRKDAAADSAERDALAQDLELAVRHAFIDYAAAVARHAIHLDHQQVSEHVLGLARARQVVGGTLLEIARAETEVARARADVATDATATRAARTRLNTLMARESDAALGSPIDPPPATVAVDARGLIADAQTARPETKAADARREAAALDLRATRREANLPSAMVGVAYFPATKPMPMHGYGVMFSVDLPWLSGQGRKRRDAQAELSAAAVRDVAQVKLAVAGEVSGALATVQSAAERYRWLTGEAAPASARARGVALNGYETGRGDFTELLAAEAVHVEVAMDVIAAKSTLDHALVDLDRAVGSPVARTPLAQGADRP